MSFLHEEVEAEVTGFSKDQQIAFAVADEYGTLTFKLSPDIWHGSSLPERGEMVIVSGLKRYTKGWRAVRARPFTLADE